MNTNSCDHDDMSDGIDHDDKTIDLRKLLPNQGDSVMIVNCGDHYEMSERRLVLMPEEATLTDDDLKHLRRGTITWN